MKKTTDPLIIREQLQGIFNRHCQAILRSMDEKTKTAIRCVLLSFHPQDDSLMVADEISDKGIKTLLTIKKVSVELIGLNERFMFHAHVKKVLPQKIFLDLPKFIEQRERRTNERITTNKHFSCFIKHSIWSPDPSDIASPPQFGIYRPLAPITNIINFCQGGACIEVRFPSLLTQLDKIQQDSKAQILFPMSQPLPLGYIKRWSKRMREQISTKEQGTRLEQKYHIGIEFFNIPETFYQKMDEFVNHLSVSEID